MTSRRTPTWSTSLPSNETYHRALGLLVGGMSLCILVLSVLVTTSGPRVRHVVLQNQDGGEVASVDQGLTAVFDRPIKVVGNLEDSVEVRPEAEYTVSQRAGQLNITFDENLLSNTEYALTVGPALEDGSGKRMEDGYEYEFVTAEPTFTYLERNYGPGAMDRVILRAPLSDEDQTLFEAPHIEYFARTRDHLAVVLPRGDDAADELRVVDLRNGDQKTPGLPGNVKVDNLASSPAGRQFAFVTRANVGRGADEVYRAGHDGRLYRYDVDDGNLLPVDTLSERGNVESVSYSRDGQALLYGTTVDGTYYLTGAAGADAEPVLLGSHDGSGGFNRAGTKIVFRTGSGVATYDARTRQLQELPGVGLDGRDSTPTFLHNRDALVYRDSVPSPSTDETASRIVIVGEDGVAKTEAEAPPGAYLLDDPAVSHDDRYILAEGALAPARFDSYPSNPQPEMARLVLYDRTGHRIMDEVRGIDPVWDP